MRGGDRCCWTSAAGGGDGCADAEQQARHAPSEPERFGDAAGELPLQALVEVGQALRHNLGPEGWRRIDLVGKLL